MNKFFLSRKNFFFFILPFLFCGCSEQSAPHTLKIAASAVPHAEILEFIQPDLEKEGVHLEIIVSDDYNMPNRALASHEVEANFFQHLPFLKEQIKEFNYPLQNFVAVEIEPMGIYSKKIKDLKNLPEGGKVALPNDPTNEIRALLLLEREGVIELNDSNNMQATVLDIAKNPKKLKFIEVEAALLPRILDDVDIAAINTNYALAAGFSPLKDALVIEGKESPYANVIAIRNQDENNPDLLLLKEAITSQKTREFILNKYKGAVFPLF